MIMLLMDKLTIWNDIHFIYYNYVLGFEGQVASFCSDFLFYSVRGLFFVV